MALIMRYERDDEYREKRDRISDRDIVEAVAGVIYKMAPARAPRKMETIMNHVVTKFHESMLSRDCGQTYYRAYTEKELQQALHEILFSCPAFLELNLSNIEYAKEIAYDDPSRAPYAVITMYDSSTPDSVNKDFIDLDACERNILDRIYELINDDDDCFFCDLSQNEDGAENEICKTCIRNPNIEDRYIHTQKPHEDRHTVCSGTCDAGYYVCCTECRRKDECPLRCKHSREENWKDCKNLTYYEVTPPEEDGGLFHIV